MKCCINNAGGGLNSPFPWRPLCLAELHSARFQDCSHCARGSLNQYRWTGFSRGSLAAAAASITFNTFLPRMAFSSSVSVEP